MNNDIRFNTDNGEFGVRAVGVIIKNDKILVQRERDGNEYALPGGKVKFGESTEEALVREWKEETGADVVIKRLLWTEECFWEWNGKKQQTISFYYLIDLVDKYDIPQTGEFVSQRDNCDVLLGWINISELQNMIFYPEFAKEHITSLDENIKHFISKE